MVSSARCPARCFSSSSRAARSALPGAKSCTGSLTGGGTWVTASNTWITLRVSCGSSTDEGAQEEQQVGGALGHPAGQVRVPGGTERDVQDRKSTRLNSSHAN